MMIGPDVRSEIGSGDSIAKSEETECNNCRVSMTDISIRNSSALSQMSGERLVICLYAMRSLTFVSGGASRRSICMTLPAFFLGHFLAVYWCDAGAGRWRGDCHRSSRLELAIVIWKLQCECRPHYCVRAVKYFQQLQLL